MRRGASAARRMWVRPPALDRSGGHRV